MAVEWNLRDDYETRVALKSLLKRPYLIVHEFIPGIPSSKISNARAHKLLHLFPQHQPEVLENLIDLGKIMAVDCCFNNLNGLPTLGSGPASANTIMFKLEVEGPEGILNFND